MALDGDTHTDNFAHLTRLPSYGEQQEAINRSPLKIDNVRIMEHPERSRSHSEINIPDRFELFILGEGEKKITEAADTRTPNSSIFTINKEDHTLANLLRAHLLKDSHVLFAGYRVPHPLFATIELRVQTDGEITPKEAVVATCRAIVMDLGTLSREFTKEFELRKMVGGEANANEK